MHIPAPKMPLPGHAESYRPPKEYLFTEEEQKQWEVSRNDDGRDDTRKKCWVHWSSAQVLLVPGCLSFFFFWLSSFILILWSFGVPPTEGAEPPLARTIAKEEETLAATHVARTRWYYVGAFCFFVLPSFGKEPCFVCCQACR